MRRAFVATLLLLLAALPAAPLDAQTDGQIRGRVTGPAGEPVAGANVLARNVADTLRTASAVTGQDGAFRLEVPAGRYRLQVNHLGFRPHAQEVAVAPGALTADVGAIALATAAVAIEGVTVETERSPVVLAADRTIYHTRDMPAVQGGVATDALRSVPELDVDLEGRVTLQGASPRIHINGRPSPMQGEALQRFLQQLPANRIERVEVMPNPSARYEAEGAGGIVNIVLRSDAGLGLSGSLGLSAGTRGQTGGFGNLAYQEGRLTLFGNGTLNTHQRSSTTLDERENLLVDPITVLRQQGAWGNRGRFGRGDLTAEFRLTDRAHLWSAVSGGGHGNDSDGSTDYLFMSVAREPTERWRQASSSTWSRSEMDVSLGVRHVIEQGRHEFSAEVRRSHQGGGNDGRFRRHVADLGGNPFDGVPPELTVNDTDENERRTWLKADYERPVAGTRVQVGYQANLQTTTNDQLREIYAALGDPAPLATTRNAFRYDETYHQGYVTLNRAFGKLSLQGGVRAERANTEFVLPTTGEAFDNRYTSLFPNANLRYDLGGGRQAGLSYSRRVQRPWIWFLNPVDMWGADPMTRRVGNPYLQPQYTHAFGSNLSWTGSRGTLRIAPYYRATENDWGQITRVDEIGVLTTTWENVASTTSYGTQLSAMLRSSGRLSGNVGVGGHREVRDASNLSQDFSGASFRYNANGNVTIAVDRTLNLQGMLWYNSPQELPQGRRSAWVMSSVGARKQLFSNKATVNLRVEDPFGLARYNFQTRDRTHVQVARNQWSMRSASLNVSYNFGRRPQSIRRPGGEETQQPQTGGAPGMPPQ